jgi:hypothetical protein
MIIMITLLSLLMLLSSQPSAGMWLVHVLQDWVCHWNSPGSNFSIRVVDDGVVMLIGLCLCLRSANSKGHGQSQAMIDEAFKLAHAQGGKKAPSQFQEGTSEKAGHGWWWWLSHCGMCLAGYSAAKSTV